jgi:hypothetical protein
VQASVVYQSITFLCSGNRLTATASLQAICKLSLVPFSARGSVVRPCRLFVALCSRSTVCAVSIVLREGLHPPDDMLYNVVSCKMHSGTCFLEPRVNETAESLEYGTAPYAQHSKASASHDRDSTASLPTDWRGGPGTGTETRRLQVPNRMARCDGRAADDDDW